MTIKVAITGAHDTGKSTLLNDVVERAAAAGLVIRTVPEVPRRLQGWLADPHAVRGDRLTILKELLIFCCQFIEEAEGRVEGADILLCDRGVLDHWVYMRYFFGKQIAEEGMADILEQRIAQYSRSYAIWFATPIEFNPYTTAPGPEEERLRRSVDAMVKQFLIEYRLPHRLITGDRERRARDVLHVLRDLCGKWPDQPPTQQRQG